MSSCWSFRTYAFCGESSISSDAPAVTCSIASRASASAWSSGPRRSSTTEASALAICVDEFERAAGCFVFVGSANPARGLDQPHHSPRFDFDEDALLVGTQFLLEVVQEAFG